MTIVEFELDFEKDAFNYWDTVNRDADFGDYKKELPEKIIEICEGKEFLECKEEILNYLSKIHNSNLAKISIKSFQEAWDNIEKEYFRRLESITKKPINKNKIIAYLTTINKCPYNIKENWFMVNFFSAIPRTCQIAGHEIIHLHFHQYFYDNIAKKIGNKRTADLKEALTVLLNLEFKDLWLVLDKGYPQHKELRNFIKNQWQSKKDFNLLLEKSIAFIK